jgi:hypothetical protein
MCSRAWVSIAIFCLALAGCADASGKPNGRAEKKKTPDQAAAKSVGDASSPVREKWETKKFGKTEDAAKGLAANDARDWLDNYLAEQQPPFKWRPDVDYLQKNHMLKFSEAKTIEVGKEDEKEEFQEVTLTVEVTNKIYSEMLEQDRKLRDDERKAVAKDRQTLLGKLLAGLLAGLVAIAGYLRLDEATKGYYTTWLRVASVALVATIGAGVWLLL